MHILYARDFAVQPWKNGGGSTSEIAVWPSGAGFDDFGWRLSMARVAAAGPFSRFADIDRSLGLLEGAGLLLAIEGRGEIELRPGSHPAAFPGDAAVAARLIDGPILDLNAMTRRGKWRHQMCRTSVAGRLPVERRGDVTIIVVRGSNGSADGRGFGAGDAICLFDAVGDEKVVLELAVRSDLWIIDFWRLNRS